MPRASVAFALALLSVSALSNASSNDPADVRGTAQPASDAHSIDLRALSGESRSKVESLLAQLPPPLSGDEATACEVILCLAGSVGAGGGVAECAAPIRKYLTIRPDRRLNFLRLCPKVSGQGDPAMDRLVELIARAPGADEESRVCSASSLNRVNRRPLGEGEFYIEDSMPSTCSAYYGHEYTDLVESVPVYVGEPLRGGFWAEPQDHAAAQARYDIDQQRRSEREREDDGIRRSAYSTL